ncbi:Hypothetical protein A7982_08926 [Minicystis rosea]|nr:Hypothetical protein A7982_08926 [Minicystis rosea]
MANDPRDEGDSAARAPEGEPADATAEPQKALPTADESANPAPPDVDEPPAAAAPEAPENKGEPAPRRPTFRETIRDLYCRMDPRTAGIYRIIVGFLCAADAIRHWAVARVFYSNDGVLTNHFHLFRPSSPYNFSVYHAFSSIEEVHVAFAFSVFCHLCLMVGWHARLFSVISFILVTSLDNRLVMVENGGYVVVNLVTMYAMFLPIDRRFSVDSWRRSWRERREKTLAEVGERYRPKWATDDYISLAVLLVVLNLAVVYFFNVVNKSGWVWRKGETIHYVLYLNRMVTGIAVFFRQILPMPVLRGLTWWTIAHEALLVCFILYPRGRRVTRTLAILGIWALHSTFGVMMRLGPFAWFMIAWSFVLIGREQWDLLERFYRRKARAAVVIIDRRSPLSFTLARIIARLDGLALIRFEESDADTSRPPLLAVRDEAGRVLVGMDALREIAQALPGGRFAFPVLRVASLGMMGRAFAYAEAHRDDVARFFGLAMPPGGEEPAPETPLGARLRLYRARAREGLLVYFTICAVMQAVLENKSIPQPVRERIKLPQFMAATIGYPRLYQGWGMFAPNPITDDGSITVDARTVDGRSIDPFTNLPPDLDLTDSDGLGLGQIHQDYFNRIRLDRNKVFHQGLEEYLRQWHLRTGRPEDELVAFDVYWVRDLCPKVGENKPYANELQAILSWRKPGYRHPPELPALPPQPKIVSAETKQPDKPTEPRTIFGWKLPSFMQN